MSVIICCYNSKQRLPETLKHLALQQVPDDLAWEIIVVDNASADDTALAAAKIWAGFEVGHCAFSVLTEIRPGKNFAFEKAVRAARYEYILTCDDDNWLAQDYIARAHQIMDRDSNIGALGGCGIFKPAEPMSPEIAALTNYYVNGPQTAAATQHWVYGAGSIYRKHAFLNLLESGWQQITTGRKGKSLICGEDVEICMMMYLTGYQITASDELLFYHFVPAQRQCVKYLTALSFWLSYSNVLLINYHLLVANDDRPIAPILKGWTLDLAGNLIKQLFYLPLRNMRRNADERLKTKFALMNVYGSFRGLLENRSRLIRHHKQLKQLLALRSTL